MGILKESTHVRFIFPFASLTSSLPNSSLITSDLVLGDFLALSAKCCLTPHSLCQRSEGLIRAGSSYLSVASNTALVVGACLSPGHLAQALNPISQPSTPQEPQGNAGHQGWGLQGQGWLWLVPWQPMPLLRSCICPLLALGE